MKPKAGRPVGEPVTAIGRKAEAVRKSLGLNIEDFAAAIGMSTVSYWRFRQGRQTPAAMEHRLIGVARGKKK